MFWALFRGVENIGEHTRVLSLWGADPKQQQVRAQVGGLSANPEGRGRGRPRRAGVMDRCILSP